MLVVQQDDSSLAVMLAVSAHGEMSQHLPTLYAMMESASYTR
jgi:hypothetical protein